MALTQILVATPSNLLSLSCGAHLTSLALGLLVPLRDLLLQRDERCVRRRSSRSRCRSRFVSLLRHLTSTPHRSLRKLATRRMRERDTERWRQPLDSTGARVSASRLAFEVHELDLLGSVRARPSWKPDGMDRSFMGQPSVSSVDLTSGGGSSASDSGNWLRCRGAVAGFARELAASLATGFRSGGCARASR
jgi:hypothetical protein